MRQQHAIAEHVAGHVADAHHREVGRLRVDAHLAEMPLDAFPRTLGGDAHRLVVVADAAAGRERVAQPMAVLGADGVGEIGERGRALVGGDDEIRVVSIDAHDLRRRHRLAGHQVVGDVQQAAQVVLVAGHAFLHERLAVGGRRRLLQHEAALGPDRHDDGVLDHLRLDEAKHLGAVILRPIGPAQPAARDLAAAQVNAFEARRVDEDLEHRLGLGQPLHLR